MVTDSDSGSVMDNTARFGETLHACPMVNNSSDDDHILFLQPTPFETPFMIRKSLLPSRLT